MKTSSIPTWQPTFQRGDNPLEELAAYGVLRSEIADKIKDTDQSGRKAFGIEETQEGMEVVTGSDEELIEYNIDLGIVASDQEFNLIVRKTSTEALHKLPKESRRSALRRILDSV